MKKYIYLKKFGSLFSFVFTVVFVSSCFFNSGMSKEECIEDFEENHLPQIIDHFEENEEIFYKAADTLFAFVKGLEDIGSFRRISLMGNSSSNENYETVKYALFTSKNDPDDSDEIIREWIAFLDDETVNIHSLTEKDLDIIFEYYREVIILESIGGMVKDASSVSFIHARPAMYNRADRVDPVLLYIEHGVSKSDNPGRINDNWIVIYTVYWSPAI